MTRNRYVHNLPLNMPLFLMILCFVHMPMNFVIVGLYIQPSLWGIAKEGIGFAPELIVWTFIVIGVDFVFLFLGIFVLMHRERTPVSDS